jgi:hypothetical protein
MNELHRRSQKKTNWHTFCGRLAWMACGGFGEAPGLLPTPDNAGDLLEGSQLKY